MLSSIKANPTDDPTIDEVRFLKEESKENNTEKLVYAIEIFPSNPEHTFKIRGSIILLINALSMDGTAIELEVDYKVENKVRVVGDISAAMQSFKSNIELIDLFSEKLLSAINDHKEIQAILESSKDHYAKINAKREQRAPSPPSSIQNKLKTFKPKEESKEKDDSLSNINKSSSGIPPIKAK